MAKTRPPWRTIFCSSTAGRNSVAWLRRDPVLLLLSVLGVLAALTLSFVHVAPNRLQTGHALMLWQTPPGAIGVALIVGWLLLVALALPRGFSRWRRWLAAGVTCAMLLTLPWLAGAAAHTLMQHATPFSRVQLGAGFWTMLLLAALGLLDRLRQLALTPLVRSVWLALVVGGIVALAASGVLSALGLSREYATQRELFNAALIRHFLLVGGALGLALAIGVPMALLAHRRAGFASKLLGVLNLMQTIPSLALFALLIGPLAWLAQHVPWINALGIGGTGAAPAIIALAAYALLPVVRGVLAGLSGVPAAALDAARGMGLRRAQILRQIQLPLAWPVLLAGLRIVVVQSIGLAAVAALIGAGGLGRFVFLGLGQGATDLVALGTLAIIALALLADALFQALAVWTEPVT